LIQAIARTSTQFTHVFAVRRIPESVTPRRSQSGASALRHWIALAPLARRNIIAELQTQE
jgi:hypothetical protein